MFSDNSTDPAVRAKEKEMLEDAEAALLYAVDLSLVNGGYSEGSTEPLLTLGNLYLDTGRLEDAKGQFEAVLGASPDCRGALDGMAIYYKLKKKQQTAAIMIAAAQRKPSEIGKAVNDIDKNNEPVSNPRIDTPANEDEAEAKLDDFTKVEVISYYDLFKEVDAATANKIKDSLKTVKEKMKITIPNITLLTQYVDINQENYIHIEEAAKAVAQELAVLSKYSIRYSMGKTVDDANTFDRMGFDIKVGGMNLSDLLRDAVANPQKYANAELPKAQVNMGSIMNWANTAIGDITKVMADPSSTDIYKTLGKSDPMFAVMEIDPFNYANSMDIMIQQYNAKILMKKMNAFTVYLIRVSSKPTQANAEIRSTYSREYMKIFEGEQEAWKALEDWYLDALEQTKDDPERREWVEKEYKVRKHKIHEDFYGRYNNCLTPYWHQAAEIAAKAYKRLEKYIPKMYNDIMPHIVAISDPKVQDMQERKLNGAIVNALSSCITAVLGAYGMGGWRDPRTCNCDIEELDKIRKELEERRLQLEYESQVKQNEQRNAFKNAEIDFNSAWYKEHIKKWEYSLDLGIIHYKTSEYYTSLKGSVWTPFASAEGSYFMNNISNKGTTSGDLALTPDAGVFSVEAKFGFTLDLVRDKNGDFHPVDIDLRASLEAKAGAGPVQASAGMSASIVRGTKVYGKLGLTGNGYIDGWKEKHLGERLAAWANAPGIPRLPDPELWNGEFILTD
jgi:hypothetical protein